MDGKGWGGNRWMGRGGEGNLDLLVDVALLPLLDGGPQRVVGVRLFGGGRQEAPLCRDGFLKIS